MDNAERTGLEPRDFLRAIVADDLAAGTHGGRVVTRFPPEPNGFLHIGHAKSICLNFGVAQEAGGRCHLRFDDTNPETEDEAFVRSIMDTVRWLGFDWGEHLYFASDYFEEMYRFAEHLIRGGNAYVDSQTAEAIAEQRGTVTEPGVASPYRERSVDENLDLFRRMRAGEFADGAHVLRAKIDMASPNMLLRDPVLYRIRHAHHYRTGDDWCIYPLYDYAHPIEDALENVTHSFCTLEFEINRALYDWVVDNIPRGERPDGIPADSRPRQYEFARLNIDYTVMSKRKLLRLVNERHVEGWDDPRLMTIAGLRRRGYTPESLRRLCDMVGVAKTESRVDVGKLEFAIRDDLNARAPRVLCVLRPLRVTITNYAPDKAETFDAPLWPRDIDAEGTRPLPFGWELYIDRDDFTEEPPADWRRLAPGWAVRLRHAYVIRCDEVVRDTAGAVVELRCSYARDSLHGDAPAEWKVGGTIHWVHATHSVPCEVRLYDRLFTVPDPDAAAAETGRDFIDFLNPDSLTVVRQARIEPYATEDMEGRFQFERLGFFVRDPSAAADGRIVYNRTVTLRDGFRGATAGGTDGESRRRKPPVVELSAEEQARLRAAAAPPRSLRLQAARERYVVELGLADDAAELLTRRADTAAFFEEVTAAGAPARTAANWVLNDVHRVAGETPLDTLRFGGADVAALLRLVESGAVSTAAAREVLAEMATTGDSPSTIIDRRGLAAVRDVGALAAIIDAVIAENGAKAAELRAGRTGLIGFFMGQVMRRSGGKADPELARRVLEERLGLTGAG